MSQTTNQETVTGIINDTLIQLKEVNLKDNDERDLLAKKIAENLSKEFNFLTKTGLLQVVRVMAGEAVDAN
jgi:hypothetical protein